MKGKNEMLLSIKSLTGKTIYEAEAPGRMNGLNVQARRALDAIDATRKEQA